MATAVLIGSVQTAHTVDVLLTNSTLKMLQQAQIDQEILTQLCALSSTEGSWETRADNIGIPEESPSSPEHAHPVHPPAGAYLFYLDQTPLERKLYCTDTVVPATVAMATAVLIGSVQTAHTVDVLLTNSTFKMLQQAQIDQEILTQLCALSSTEGSWETREDNKGSPEESPSSPEHAHPVHPPPGAYLFCLDQTPLERKLYCPDTEVKESVMYSGVNKSTSNSRQTKRTKNKSSNKTESSVPFTWCLTAVIFGIFCFILLVTDRILGHMVMSSKAFQGHLKYQPQKLPLDNITQEDNFMLKNTTFTEGPLHTGSKSSTCERKHSCSGEKCYYFWCDLKTYEESQKFCKKFYTALLKIQDEKELKFIQSQLSSKTSYSWIGLSHKGANHFWTWEDNSAPSLPSLFFITKQQTKTGSCVRIAARKMEVSDCSRRSNYVCEKKIAGHAT
ncbi:C-type lectin domain family 7 member A-like [Phyllostomus hastatus]|uniref:C-type lectin domain family 7 member A-like n=1 Tax=Phyllostomus hastatus TaxID=9423 RepID=UPI001E681B58|nr:C-type lectin domain family 7 member A-like [Phyllostomus hastatus]